MPSTGKTHSEYRLNQRTECPHPMHLDSVEGRAEALAASRAPWRSIYNNQPQDLAMRRSWMSLTGGRGGKEGGSLLNAVPD